MTAIPEAASVRSRSFQAYVTRAQRTLLERAVWLTRPGGTQLQAAEIDLDWSRWGEWGWSPSTWIRVGWSTLSRKLAICS